MSIVYLILGAIGILFLIGIIGMFFPKAGECLFEIFQDVIENLIDD